MKKIRLDQLVFDKGLAESRERAKAYITGALSARLDLGQGSGPMDHTFDIKSAFTEEAAE